MPDAWKMPHAHPLGARVLTPADPTFHHYGHPAVWGALAGDEDQHNPFRDYDWEDNATIDRHGWDDAEQAHPGYVKDFHEAYARHLNKAHLMVSVPTHLIGQIVHDGRLKSQFETTESRGRYNHEGRASVENHLFGYPHDHPAHARPIYGYLSTHPYLDASTAGYGATSLVLHKPALWHRTTFTGDDSWNRLYNVSAAPVGDYGTDPHHLRHAVPIDHLGFHVEEAGRMTPHRLAEQMEQQTPTERARDFWSPHSRLWSGSAYPEAQYHGGVATHHFRFAILRSPDRDGRAHPTRMSDTALEAAEHLMNAGIPWVHTVGYRPPVAGDRSHMPGHSELHLPPGFPGPGRHRAGIIAAFDDPDAAFITSAPRRPDGQSTDQQAPSIFERHVRWARPGGGWLLTHTGTGEGMHQLACAADPEWGLSAAMPLESFLARGYWQHLDSPVQAEYVLQVCRKDGAS